MIQRPSGKPERRRHPRAITDFSAVVNAHGRAYPARVVNLSMGGALLDLGPRAPDPPVRIGDAVSIDVTYASIVGPLRLNATAVLWNMALGPIPMLAIQFQEVGEAESEVLEQLMFEALAQIRGRAAARALTPRSRPPSRRGE